MFHSLGITSYVAGFVYSKTMAYHQKKHNCKLCSIEEGHEMSSKFIDLKKYDESCRLLNPPVKFLKLIDIAGKLFEENYSSIETENNLVQKLIDIIKKKVEFGCNQFPMYFLLHLFIRMRIYYFLKKKNLLLKTRLGRKKLKNLI